MGMLDKGSGKAAPGGNISKPLMIALGTLLLNKMTAGSQPSTPQTGSAGPSDGGLVGGLGGLIQKLKTAGHDDTVKSWVGTGQNKPIEPGQLGSALGQQTIKVLAQKTGLSEQDLVSQLSKALPGLVDRLTPNGRVSDPKEIAALLKQ